MTIVIDATSLLSLAFVIGLGYCAWKFVGLLYHNMIVIPRELRAEMPPVVPTPINFNKFMGL
jgi:hypothetical protein